MNINQFFNKIIKANMLVKSDEVTCNVSYLLDKAYYLARKIENYQVDRVFFNIQNSPLTIIIYLSSFIANIKNYTAVNSRLTQYELKYILKKNSIFITDTDIDANFKIWLEKGNVYLLSVETPYLFIENIPYSANRTIFGVANIGHITSGTTTFYRTFTHSIDQIIHYAELRQHDLGLSKNDHLLVCLSLNHAYAFSYQLLPALIMGLKITLLPTYSTHGIDKDYF